VTISEGITTASNYSYFQEKSKTGFVGLSNQGATCYLNSLLQTLYMTPEFKTALYNWLYSAEDGDSAACIPYQLQKLFGLLQSGLSAVQETKNLTLSFGWEATDAFRQHDVQELLRKLFEAMEITFKHGNLQDTKATPVNTLYEGTLKDYIKCTEQPNHERVRFDPFMDILLSIRNVNSLEEALDLYTEAEILDGENQWFCERCDKKVRADKGLRLNTAPLFLTLQLKRFDFDYQTWQRVKLNNRVTFPMEIDIKKWLTEDSPNQNHSQFELFSVLIHQGGAQGGHYYAMIKDIKTGKWFKFNDASVMEIEAKDVEAMYGEAAGVGVDEKGQNKIVRNKLFSSNAYLLLYRRKGEPLPEEKPFPDYIQKMIHEENENFNKAKEEFIQRRDNLPLDVYFKDTVIKLHIDKNKTLKDATLQAFTIAGLTGSQYTLDCVRLRKYNPETGTLGKVWSTDEEKTQKTLDQLGVLKTSILKLEIREPNENFLHDSGEFKLSIIKAVENKFEPPVHIVVPSREATVADLRNLLETLTGWPLDKIRLIKVNAEAVCMILTKEDDEKQLQKDLGYVDGNSIHIEKFENDSDPSVIIQLFEEASNSIQIYVNKLNEREYTEEISTNKKKKLSELRHQIATHLNIAP